ncbi:unnamed protein product [Amoebophrya sp. A120]|nr:unnamed protein product [Amoebophrya sp. A120]|eukprot:GSA120T00009980001.1
MLHRQQHQLASPAAGHSHAVRAKTGARTMRAQNVLAQDQDLDSAGDIQDAHHNSSPLQGARRRSSSSGSNKEQQQQSFLTLQHQVKQIQQEIHHLEQQELPDMQIELEQLLEKEEQIEEEIELLAKKVNETKHTFGEKNTRKASELKILKHKLERTKKANAIVDQERLELSLGMRVVKANSLEPEVDNFLLMRKALVASRGLSPSAELQFERNAGGNAGINNAGGNATLFGSAAVNVHQHIEKAVHLHSKNVGGAGLEHHGHSAGANGVTNVNSVELSTAYPSWQHPHAHAVPTTTAGGQHQDAPGAASAGFDGINRSSAPQEHEASVASRTGTAGGNIMGNNRAGQAQGPSSTSRINNGLSSAAASPALSKASVVRQQQQARSAGSKVKFNYLPTNRTTGGGSNGAVNGAAAQAAVRATRPQTAMQNLPSRAGGPRENKGSNMIPQQGAPISFTANNDDEQERRTAFSNTNTVSVQVVSPEANRARNKGFDVGQTKIRLPEGSVVSTSSMNFRDSGISEGADPFDPTKPMAPMVRKAPNISGLRGR